MKTSVYASPTAATCLLSQIKVGRRLQNQDGSNAADTDFAEETAANVAEFVDTAVMGAVRAVCSRLWEKTALSDLHTHIL